MQRKSLTDILRNGEAERIRDAWDTTEAAADFAHVPTGEYTCHVVAGELFNSRTNGTPGYKLAFKILEGEYSGRQVWHDLWLPTGAELFTRDGRQFARWKNAKGKARTAAVTTGTDGTERIVTIASTWTAKYRDGQGIVREVATGCRDKQAAQSVLSDLKRRAELVKAGVVSTAEETIASHNTRPLADHFNNYVSHLEAKECSPIRIANMQAQFTRVCEDCGFRRLSDLDAERLTKWLLEQQRAGMSAATRNGYRETFVMFGNWCCEGVRPRLLKSPFLKVPRAQVRTDRRRQRRAMTEAELSRLLTIASLRPLAEYGRESIPKPKDEQRGRSTWRKSPPTLNTIQEAEERARERLSENPDLIAELERRGRERRLTYKTLVLTGLRRNELASITIGQCRLDGPTPHLELAAADEKNREGSLVPLRSDLAAELGRWIESKAEANRAATCDASTVRFDSTIVRDRNRNRRDSRSPEGQICHELTTEDLFDVPSGLVRILNRDLKAAGIQKKDDRGRSIDVHALRHTFGTLLSKGGVSPRTAQAAMRHSHIDLTMNVYTDPRLLDVQGALDVLPSLPTGDSSGREIQRATGTDDAPVRSAVAPMVAPNLVQPSIRESTAATSAESHRDGAGSASRTAKSVSVKRKDPLSPADNGPRRIGVTVLRLNR